MYLLSLFRKLNINIPGTQPASIAGVLSNKLRKKSVSKPQKAGRRAIPIGKLVAPIFGEKMLQNQVLLAVSIRICAAYTRIGMIVSVRVMYFQSRGASLAIIGAMASAYLISNFVFQYPSGWIAYPSGR